MPSAAECHARPAALADLGAAVALLNVASRAAAGAEDFTPAMLRKAWSTPGLQLDADTRVLVAPDGALLGYAELWWRLPGALTELWTAVAPEHPRRAALGAELLAWGEARARERSAAAPSGRALLLRVETDAGDAASLASLAAAGLLPVRRRVRFERELRAADDETVVWPAGLVVHGLAGEDDERAAHAAEREAFRDHWGEAETDVAESWRRFRHWLHGDPDFDPRLCWLAREGGRVAGFLFAFPACERARDTARIPSLGVLRGWRRRGLARALLLHAFRELARAGVARVCLEADADSLTGAGLLYRGAGMHETRRWIVCEKVLRPGVHAGSVNLPAG